MYCYPEKIDEERAKFILSLKKQDKVKLIWDSCKNTSNKGEKWYDQKTYLKKVDEYCSHSLNNSGVTKIAYDFSKKMKTNGRLFVKGFGLQGMEKKLRCFLVNNGYNDYDMWNAHFCILAYMLQHYCFNGNEAAFKKQFKYIWFYIQSPKNRAEVQKMTELSKTELLELLNSNFCPEDVNDYAKKFNSQCKKAQEMFYDITPDELKQYEHFKNDNEKNKRGCFLNRLLCIHENMMLNLVIKHYENNGDNPFATLMFDGLYISAELPDQVDVLNEITKEHGITWTMKPPNAFIEESDYYKKRDELSLYEMKDYDTVKKQFEEKHFMIEYPLTYVKETTISGRDTVNMYNDTDFKAVVKPWVFEEYKLGKLVRTSVFERWCSDKDRRFFKKLDFIPTLTENKEIYNTFTGFDYSDYEKVDFQQSDKLINMFRSTISTLVDHDSESIEWVTRFFADIFQFPDRLPGCSPLFKSRQGFGKDTIIDCISKLLNNQYLCRTANPDDIFGPFNGVIANKLILQFNEMEGKHGFANKDKLKNLITEGHTIVNEKNMKPYEQSNYLRVIICSNNSNPLEIPSGDRRFAVFEADRVKPPISHFSEMRELMEDDDELYSLYQYLYTYDLGSVSLRDCRPITRAYKTMKSHCIHPFNSWLDGALDEFKTTFTIYRIKKNTDENIIIISSSDIFETYKNYMEDTNQPLYKFNQKRIMLDMLAALKVYSTPSKIDGNTLQCYMFDLKQTKILLREYLDKDKKDILDLDNSDEWE